MGSSNRFGLYVGAALFLVAGMASAQVTRTATFENFSAGAIFKPSFIDLLSGIGFRNSTHPNHDFSISYSGRYFGASTYLTAGGYSTDPDGGFLGSDFGFTADLPAPASRVRLDVIAPTGTTLQAYNANGVLLAEQSIPAGVTDPFVTLEVTSPGYDIALFKVVARAGGAAYDNISYTTLPEPGPLTLVAGASVVALQRRRRR